MLRIQPPAQSVVDRLDRALDRTVKPPVRWTLGHGLPRIVIGRAARRGDLQGRLIETARTSGDLADLLPIFNEARAAGPLARGRLSAVSCSHPAVKEVLSDSSFVTGLPDFAGGLISRLSAWSASEVFSPVQPPSLLVTEPPDHTRYRKLVTRVFSVKAVNGLKERTQQVASELVDQLDSAGGDPVDLVTRYCGLLPVTVISEILGVPTSERDQILAWGEGAAASLDLGLGWEKFRTVEKALAGFEGWLTAHLDRLRREPGDNLLSQLIAAQEDGVGLTERELRATAGLVLAAGFETTVNLLGNGIALLAANRDQLDGLLADPSGWGNAVDEILRFDPPVLLTARLSTQETEVVGVRVPAGLMVTTVLAAANRDPDVFTDPDRFDVNRVNARDHVSFSAGRHYCLGAQLARMEGEIGLRTLFERHRDLQLLPGSARRETRILRGYSTLPARLS